MKKTRTRHFVKHQAHVKRLRKYLELIRRCSQSEDAKCPLEDCQLAIEYLPNPPACIEVRHVCTCATPCAECKCAASNFGALAEIKPDPPATRPALVLDAVEMTSAVLPDSPACIAAPSDAIGGSEVANPLSTKQSRWDRLKRWFFLAIASLCSYRQGGVNYRPPVKQE